MSALQVEVKVQCGRGDIRRVCGRWDLGKHQPDRGDHAAPAQASTLVRSSFTLPPGSPSPITTLRM